MNWNTNPKIDINNILVIIFAAYSLSLLFGSVFFISPIIIGDGHEYLGMTVSFFNHFTPDLRGEDIALREQIENKNGINFGKNFAYSGYFKSLGGDWYSYHFWIYSLFNLPVFAFLHYFNFNELRSFQITNSLLLIFSLFILLHITNLTRPQKTWLFLFSACSPVLLYVIWTHPEVFTYSFVVVAVAFYFKKDYRLAVLASSLASLQNPPLSILTIYIIIYGWKATGLRFRELSILSVCASISLIPYVFYYSNYHVLSLIVSCGSANISYISFDKIFSLFFDLNFGMLPYIPLLMFLSIFMLIASIARKNLVIPSLWLVLIIMATMCSTAGNWNCGMTYINRYSVWMLPLIILIVIYDISKFSSKKINTYLFISFLITLLITGYLLYNPAGGDYLRFNFISNEVLINTPGLYNPPYDVFAERALGREIEWETGFPDRLPLIFIYNGIPRKALTDYEGLSWIERFTGNPIKKANSEQIKKSKMGYINFENEIFKFPYNESELTIYGKKEIKDVLIRSRKFPFLTKGFFGIEDWSGTPTSWMPAEATILVNSSENRTAILSLRATSFYSNRTLEIYAGDELLTGVAITPDGLVEINVPISLQKTQTSFRLHVPEGCDRPSDKPELNSYDSRCLSMAVQNLNVMTVGLNVLNNDKIKMPGKSTSGIEAMDG